MTKQIEQLDADRLIDPTRRKLLLGSAGAVGLAGFLGGGIWSVSAEALAEICRLTNCWAFRASPPLPPTR